MSRKNKRKRAGAPAIDPNERRQKQLEERRRQRAEAQAAAVRQQRRERVVRFSLIGLVVAALVWLIFFKGGGGPTEINGHTVQALSQEGVGDHPADPEAIVYDTKPPASGPHSSEVAECGTHADQIPDYLQVHSLEHGAVAIQFDPDLAAPEIKKIEEIVGRYNENTLSAPYQGMQTPIAVTAWGRLMRLDTLDETAIVGFIDAFAGKGPEAGQTCVNSSDEPFTPSPGPSPSGNQTPAESPSPEGTETPSQ
jgi:hypothetical protein